MKNMPLIFGMFLSLNLLGCDTQVTSNTAKAEPRTMIIGGVPAHDKDFKRAEIVSVHTSQK